MSENLFLITISLIAGTCLAIFGLKAISALFIARTQSSKEGDYRSLSLNAVSSNAQISTQLTSLLDELRDVKERVVRIEKILKDVDS
jgi:hypothetical protein